MVKKYLVETVSMFRMRYVVEAEEPDHAADEVCMEGAEEFGQRHVAENIINVREVSDDEIPKLFFEDHPYLEGWGPERAFDYITKIKP
jgi:hypothetical protein